MSYTYTKYTTYHESSPQNIVEVDAFSERGAKVKTRRILSSLRIIYPTEKLDRIIIKEIEK